MGEAREEVKRKKLEFNPARDFPITNAVLTAGLIALVPWLFHSVLLSTDQRTMLVVCLVGVAVGILSCEWAAERLGTALSTGMFAGEPFNDPLQVAVALPTGKRSKQMTKFKSQVWQLVIHVVMVVVETKVLSEMLDENGLNLLESPWRLSYLASPNPPLIETLYIFQMAVWIITGLFHVFVFERQSDYLVMLAHHLATIGLLGVSLQYDFTRFGLVVVYVHDISDIVIDLLKLTNYLKMQDKAGFFVVEMVFTTNLVTWVYYRLYVLPYIIIWQGSVQPALCAYYLQLPEIAGSAEKLVVYAAEHGLCHSAAGDGVAHRIITEGIETAVKRGDVSPYHSILYSSLVSVLGMCILTLMHVYWYALFLRILHGLLFDADAHETGAKQYEGDDGLVDSPKSSQKKTD